MDQQTQAAPTTAEPPISKSAAAKARAQAFWSKFPTPEARSQYMKERFAKVRAKKRSKSATRPHPPVARLPRSSAEFAAVDQSDAANAIFKLRLFLGDLLTILDGINDYRGGATEPGFALTIDGQTCARRVLLSVSSLIQDKLCNLDIAGTQVGEEKVYL